MRVFFLKKKAILWGIVLLVVILALIILFRLTAGHKEVYREMIALLGII